ncbi:MAG TPA: BamA/TamA family outer membrane protein [Longimicrobium sp.]|jgi:hypothetical protein
MTIADVRLATTRPAAAALAAALCLPAALLAQSGTPSSGTTSVVAGEEYRAGPLKRWLLGREYRPLWTEPVQVEVLDLGAFAGGLTPTRRGGGNQTISLRFQGGDGREYAFRSVNKDPGRSLHADFKGTLVESVLDDQVSSLVPAGQLASDVLLDAVGILHPSARLYLMPDDPRLGEFRQEFAGMLGTVEERPAAGRTGHPVLARAAAIEDTDEFLEALGSGAGHRMDAREYLAVRLMDMFLGDWDRHDDQYNWARFDSAGAHRWRPIPRDRDYVFADYDGFLIDLARSQVPNAVRFLPHYGGQLRGLMLNAQLMDRRLLGELPRAVWDSVAASLKARLTDRVIDDALARLPAPYVAREGAELRATLRGRRDLLPGLAGDFYAELAREAEVHAKEAADFAAVERLADGGVEVVLRSGGEQGPEYFRRRFVPAETREVRLFLYGGEDRARVFGAGPDETIVRLIGGQGDDELRDETRTGGHVAFYDYQGDDRFFPRSGTRIDRSRWDPPKFERGQGRTPPREWGRSSSLFSPTLAWRRHAGPVVGFGPSWTRWGFRRFPYAAKGSVALLWAPQHTRFGAEYQGDYVAVGSRRSLSVLLRATEIAAVSFHGFGNDAPEVDTDLARVWERQLLLDAEHRWTLSPDAEASFGTELRWTDPQPEPLAPATLAPSGDHSFGLAGARAGVHVDARDTSGFPRHGFTLELVGAGYPLATGDAGAFGDVRAVGTAYLSPPGRGPTLALRAGGERLWGDFPLQYAAFLGGSSTVRGHRGERFAGDAAAYGSAELRQPLARVELVVKGTLGAFALADAGRVWFEGDSDGDWHTAVGGGLFFSFLDHARTVSVAYAHGEVGRVHFKVGMPF